MAQCRPEGTAGREARTLSVISAEALDEPMVALDQLQASVEALGRALHGCGVVRGECDSVDTGTDKRVDRAYQAVLSVLQQVRRALDGERANDATTGDRRISLSPPPLTTEQKQQRVLPAGDGHGGCELVSVLPTLARPHPDHRGAVAPFTAFASASTEHSIANDHTDAPPSIVTLHQSTTGPAMPAVLVSAGQEDPDVARWLNENFTQVKMPKRNEQSALLDVGSSGSGTDAQLTSLSAATAAQPSRNVAFLSKGAHSTSSQVSPAADKALLPAAIAASATPPPPLLGDHRVSICDGAPSTSNASEIGEPTSKRTSNAGTQEGLDDSGGADGTQEDFAASVASRYARKSMVSRCKSSSTSALVRRLEEHRIDWLDVDNIDFDIFEVLKQFSGDHAKVFVSVCANVLFRYHFVHTMGLDTTKLLNFLRAVQRCYQDENPYHNSVHAADVLQTAHIYLTANDVRDNFTNEEVLCVLFSALVHDVGHLGIGNSFLIKTHHPLASLYNDNSPLESMHASLAFHLLAKDENNFFEQAADWSDEKAEQFRAQVLKVVVGTDMKFHQQCTTAVVDILADGVIEDDEIGTLLSAIVHAADLSNPMKPLKIYKNWCDRVMAEFWQQGDEERRRGIPITMMCDRASCAIAASQVGFINFVVKPFMREFAVLLPEKWMQRLEENLAFMTEHRTEPYDIAQIQQLSSKRWADHWHRSPLAKMLKETVVSRTSCDSFTSGPSARASLDAASTSASLSPQHQQQHQQQQQQQRLEQISADQHLAEARRRIADAAHLLREIAVAAHLMRRVASMASAEAARHLRDPFPTKLDILASNQHFAQNLFRLIHHEHLHVDSPQSAVLEQLLAKLLGGGADGAAKPSDVAAATTAVVLDDRRWCAARVRQLFHRECADGAAASASGLEPQDWLSVLKPHLEMLEVADGEFRMDLSSTCNSSTEAGDSSLRPERITALLFDFLFDVVKTWTALMDFTTAFRTKDTLQARRHKEHLHLATGGASGNLGGGQLVGGGGSRAASSLGVVTPGTEYLQDCVYAAVLSPWAHKDAQDLAVRRRTPSSGLLTPQLGAVRGIESNSLRPSPAPTPTASAAPSSLAAATATRLAPRGQRLLPSILSGGPDVPAHSAAAHHHPAAPYSLSASPAAQRTSPFDTEDSQWRDGRSIVASADAAPFGGGGSGGRDDDDRGAAALVARGTRSPSSRPGRNASLVNADESVMMWTLPELREPTFALPQLQFPEHGPTAAVASAGSLRAGAALHDAVGDGTSSDAAPLLPRHSHRRLLDLSSSSSSAPTSGAAHHGSSATLRLTPTNRGSMRTPLPEVLMHHLPDEAAQRSQRSHTAPIDFYDTIHSDSLARVVQTTTTTVGSGRRQPSVRSHVHSGPLDEAPLSLHSTHSDSASLPAIPQFYLRNRSWSRSSPVSGGGGEMESPKSPTSGRPNRAAAAAAAAAAIGGDNLYTPSGNSSFSPRAGAPDPE